MLRLSCNCGVSRSVAITILALSSVSWAADEPVATVRLDPTIQARIDDVAAAIDADLAAEAGPYSERKGKHDQAEEQLALALIRLERLSRDDRKKLVEQLVFADVAGKGDGARMVLFSVLKNMAIDKAALLSAIEPWIGNAAHPEVQDACETVADFIEIRNHSGKVDFNSYHSYLGACRNQQLELSVGIVARMLRSSPGDALELLALTFGEEDRQELLWSGHLIEDWAWRNCHGFGDSHNMDAEAKAELAKLSVREEWWARLFVVEFIGQHPGIAETEVVLALAEDKNPNVQATAKRRLSALVRDFETIRNIKNGVP